MEQEVTPEWLEYARIINGLHANWEPHPGQIPVGKALFVDGCKDIFIQAGRNWGKSEFVAYALWRHALFNPGSENYYFGPYMKQAREILWASGRIQRFGPRDWLASDPNNTEMRIILTNGSFIKLDGSDNVEAYRGIKPKGLSIFDEFKDFRPEFYEAYDPNRAAFSAPLIIVGTPPDRSCQFTELAAEFARNPYKKFFHAPTRQNPHISREWLEAKRLELVARGEEDVWQREYEALFIPGGASKIFPMIKPSIIQPHDEVVRTVSRDRKKLQWYWCADPAAATVFAVLFVAINPYTKHVYILDELYETEQGRMTVKSIGREILSKRDSLWDREWRQVYDEAETWFMNEMLDNFDEHLEPSQKAANDKEHGLSLIKDIMLAEKITISDRCKKLYWELDNYYKDKNGKIPKTNDHLIDTLRYILGTSFYALKDVHEPNEKEIENKRAYRISDDFPHLTDMGAPTDEWNS